MYICRPLPELESASLQMQSSNTTLQTASPPSCRLHPTVLQTEGSSLLWLPWSAQCPPNATKCYQGAAQLSQGLQKSSPADFLRGRRQRR